MEIPVTRIFLMLMFIFTLLSNVCNYISIAVDYWISIQPVITNVGTTPRNLWSNSVVLTVRALIATGTSLNILSLLLALLSVISLFIRVLRDKFAMYFVFGTLITGLLAILFNAVGWYYISSDFTSTLNANIASVIKFQWSYWLMPASFGCSILAAVFAASIVGCAFSLNKKEKRAAKLEQQQANPRYPVIYANDAYNSSDLPNTSIPRTTSATYVFQSESTIQSEQRVLRL